MPSSTSFPSGHSASAAAFAVAVGSGLPAAAVPLGLLAAAVGYSRVHTGVHYPADVVGGLALGVVSGVAVIRADRRWTAAGPRRA
jgi:undecaprenyl-diphosphatase